MAPQGQAGLNLASAVPGTFRIRQLFSSQTEDRGGREGTGTGRSREEQPPPNAMLLLHKPLVPSLVSDSFLGRVLAGIRVSHATVFYFSFFLPPLSPPPTFCLVYVCMYACAHTRVCEGGSGCGVQGTNVRCYSSSGHLLLLLTQELSLARNSPSRLSWLPSDPQRPCVFPASRCWDYTYALPCHVF